VKAIIITADGLEHRYVTNRLSRVLGNDLSAIIVEQHSNQEVFFKKVRHLAKRYGYWRILERITTKILRNVLRENQRRKLALRKVLGESCLGFDYCCSVTIVPSANAPHSVELLKNIKPDFLFIYGTSVIGGKLLSIPSRAALNLHTGISPYYRGSDTVFWALFNNDPQMVGSTVHRCTPDIDGGDIYGTVSVKLAPSDDRHMAFAKCVKEGAELYASIANRLVCGETITGHIQDLTIGKHYYFKDLTILHELRLKYRQATGKLQRLIRDSGNN
jgi:methionyl-tRNA formyltransferase